MLTTPTQSYRRDLGDGLILRWSTADDTERIAQLVSMVFRSKADEPPNRWMVDTIHRLMHGDHPFMGSGDYGVIEDTSKEGNPLVACTCLWHHTWNYEGIAFPVGRPEIVGSDPAYRNRGLIRALFDMVHERSEAEGDLVQAITGIPYFYRQFGYEYALDLGGRRTTYLALIPKVKEGESEPYTLREATTEDIPVLQEYYAHRLGNSIVWLDIPDKQWRYDIEGWKNHPDLSRPSTYLMIVDTTGAARGYLLTPARRWGPHLNIWDMGLAPGVNVQTMMPSLLRALQSYGTQLPTNKPDTEPFSAISFHLGRTHPVYDALGQERAPGYEPPYAWYIRVRDIPAFLRHIAPALEKRVATSAIAGYTGELKIDFYRGGLRLVFTDGRLSSAEHWRVPAYDSNADMGIPTQVFLQLLFGYRSLDDLRYAFPDIWVKNDVEIIIKTLFPTRPSFVFG